MGYPPGTDGRDYPQDPMQVIGESLREITCFNLAISQILVDNGVINEKELESYVDQFKEGFDGMVSK